MLYNGIADTQIETWIASLPHLMANLLFMSNENSHVFPIVYVSGH